MLHGERYVYCRDSKNNKVQVTTHIKAWYSVEKAPSYKKISEQGYYTLAIRQEKDKYVDGKKEKMSDRRFEIRVPACELEALLKDAKLCHMDDELL